MLLLPGCTVKKHTHPQNSDRLRNRSILPVIASTRRVRGNLSATMRDCFTSFAMTTFLSLFLGRIFLEMQIVPTSILNHEE